MAQLTPLPQALHTVLRRKRRVASRRISSYSIHFTTQLNYYYYPCVATEAQPSDETTQLPRSRSGGDEPADTRHGGGPVDLGGVATETAEGAMVAAEAAMAAAATTMRTMADGVAMTTPVAAMGGGSAAEMRRRCVAVLAVGRCGSEGRAWREGGGEGGEGRSEAAARAARGGQRRRRRRR